MSALGVFGLIACYVAMATLLLSLNIASLWQWWIKAAAIAAMTGFYVGTYFSISSMLGWPAASAPPLQFQLLASTIVEPDKRSQEGGAIYLWVREIDGDNVPINPPRAYRIGFDDRLARDVASAQREIDAGAEMKGTATAAPDEQGDQTEEQKLGNVNESSEVTSTEDTVPFQMQSRSLSFERLPPVTLPDKPPL
jgi:hypothetical protein